MMMDLSNAPEQNAAASSLASERFSELLQELRNQIPLLLVVRTDPKLKGSQVRKAMMADLQDLNQNVFVSDDLRDLLPNHVKSALGPFHMLCIAQYCVGKPYDELVKQEKEQYNAVLQVKQLYDEGRFENSTEENMLFLRELCVAGLIQFDNDALIRFDASERVRHQQCISARDDMLNYINLLRDSSEYEPYECPYPVVVHARDTVNMPVSLTNILFDPTAPLERQVIAGTAPLPPKMIVVPKNRIHLPGQILQQLGPFTSLEEGAPFMAMSHSELVEYLAIRDAQRSRNSENLLARNMAAFGDTDEAARETIKQLRDCDLLRVPRSQRTNLGKAVRAIEASVRVLCALREREASGEHDAVEKGSRDYAHVGYMLFTRQRDEKERAREARQHQKRPIQSTSNKVICEMSDEGQSSVDTVPLKRARGECSGKGGSGSDAEMKPDEIDGSVARCHRSQSKIKQLLMHRKAEEECRRADMSGAVLKKESPQPHARIMKLLMRRKAEEELRKKGPDLREVTPTKQEIRRLKRLEVVRKRKERAERKRLHALEQKNSVLEVDDSSIQSVPRSPTSRTYSSVSMTTTPDPMPAEDMRDGFPSLSKPTVRPARHRTDSLRSVGEELHASVSVPCVSPLLDAIVQESLSVVHEIDSLKKQIDDNKRKFGEE